MKGFISMNHDSFLLINFVESIKKGIVYSKQEGKLKIEHKCQNIPVL